MANNDSAEAKKEVSSTVDEIIKSASTRLKSLDDMRRSGWRWSSVLVGIIVFVFIFFAALYLIQAPVFFALQFWPELVALQAIAGILAGVAFFSIQRRRGRKDKIMEALILLNKLRTERDQAVSENALHLLESVIELMPKVRESYDTDAVVGGFLGLVLGSILGGNLGIGLLIGLVIGIYIKLQGDRKLDKETSKYEDLARRLKQQKDEFLASL